MKLTLGNLQTIHNAIRRLEQDVYGHVNFILQENFKDFIINEETSTESFIYHTVQYNKYGEIEIILNEKDNNNENSTDY